MTSVSSRETDVITTNMSEGTGFTPVPDQEEFFEWICLKLRFIFSPEEYIVIVVKRSNKLKHEAKMQKMTWSIQVKTHAGV